MRQVRSFLILAGAAAMAACASPSPTVTALPAAAAPSSSVLVPPDGYERVVSRDGTELFCRDDAITGSRVQHDKVCLTAAQVKAGQDSGQNFMQGVQRGAAGATGAGTGGAGAAAAAAGGR
jgi:hypothetical protein